MPSAPPSSLVPATAQSDQFGKLPVWRSFSFRLALFLCLAFFLVIGAVGVFSYNTIQRTQNEGFKQRLFSLALSLSKSIDPQQLLGAIAEESNQGPNSQLIYRRLRAVADQEQDVESIYIMLPGKSPGKLCFLLDASKLSRVATKGEEYDAAEIPAMMQGFNGVVVEEEPVGDEFGTTQSSYAPLYDPSGRVVALLGVDVLSANVELIQARITALCVWLFGAALLVLLLLCLWVGHQIRKPLSEILKATSEIAQGRLDAYVPSQRSDEFGTLSDNFSIMVSNLRDRERLRETFGLYISRELADSLLKEGKVPSLGGTECVATILFLDVQAFTRISETLSPVETIGMLNDYLGAMVEVIKEHSGCTLDFVGDGIITIFGAPFYQPNHAHDAVRCALAMDKRIKELNTQWIESGLASRWTRAGVDSVQIRIGLHTGSLVAGNIGSSSRMKYSVIGDTVNIAARLEDLNKSFGTSILMSEEVKIRLPLDLSSAFVDRGMVPVRGRQHTIRVYSTQ